MKEQMTKYSREIEGEKGNYYWSVQFDITDNGYVGITQSNDGLQRVLLSPKQVDELVAFLKEIK